jgi:hypothetical protein
LQLKLKYKIIQIDDVVVEKAPRKKNKFSKKDLGVEFAPSKINKTHPNENKALHVVIYAEFYFFKNINVI